jgi:hypothetical protein
MSKHLTKKKYFLCQKVQMKVSRGFLQTFFLHDYVWVWHPRLWWNGMVFLDRGQWWWRRAAASRFPQQFTWWIVLTGSSSGTGFSAGRGIPLGLGMYRCQCRQRNPLHVTARNVVKIHPNSKQLTKPSLCTQTKSFLTNRIHPGT